MTKLIPSSYSLFYFPYFLITFSHRPGWVANEIYFPCHQTFFTLLGNYSFHQSFYTNFFSLVPFSISSLTSNFCFALAVTKISTDEASKSTFSLSLFSSQLILLLTYFPHKGEEIPSHKRVTVLTTLSSAIQFPY